MNDMCRCGASIPIGHRCACFPIEDKPEHVLVPIPLLERLIDHAHDLVLKTEHLSDQGERYKRAQEALLADIQDAEAIIEA